MCGRLAEVVRFSRAVGWGGLGWTGAGGGRVRIRVGFEGWGEFTVRVGRDGGSGGDRGWG